MKKSELKAKLVDKLLPKPEKKITVPGLGEITIQSPSFEKVYQLSLENQSIGEKGIKFAITLMAVKELSTEDILRLAQDNDGFQVAALVNAVSEALNLGELS